MPLVKPLVSSQISNYYTLGLEHTSHKCNDDDVIKRFLSKESAQVKCIIMINHCDYNIDQNNCDYNFPHLGTDMSAMRSQEFCRGS